MIFEIRENRSGEVLYHKHLPEGYSLNIEALTDEWLETKEFVRTPNDGIIPAGCGEYRSEIRNQNTTSLWDALDWFSRPL